MTIGGGIRMFAGKRKPPATEQGGATAGEGGTSTASTSTTTPAPPPPTTTTTETITASKEKEHNTTTGATKVVTNPPPPPTTTLRASVSGCTLFSTGSRKTPNDDGFDSALFGSTVSNSAKMNAPDAAKNNAAAGGAMGGVASFLQKTKSPAPVENHPSTKTKIGVPPPALPTVPASKTASKERVVPGTAVTGATTTIDSTSVSRETPAKHAMTGDPAIAIGVETVAHGTQNPREQSGSHDGNQHPSVNKQTGDKVVDSSTKKDVANTMAASKTLPTRGQKSIVRIGTGPTTETTNDTTTCDRMFTTATASSLANQRHGSTVPTTTRCLGSVMPTRTTANDRTNGNGLAERTDASGGEASMKTFNTTLVPTTTNTGTTRTGVALTSRSNAGTIRTTAGGTVAGTTLLQTPAGKPTGARRNAQLVTPETDAASLTTKRLGTSAPTRGSFISLAPKANTREEPATASAPSSRSVGRSRHAPKNHGAPESDGTLMVRHGGVTETSARTTACPDMAVRRNDGGRTALTGTGSVVANSNKDNVNGNSANGDPCPEEEFEDLLSGFLTNIRDGIDLMDKSDDELLRLDVELSKIYGTTLEQRGEIWSLLSEASRVQRQHDDKIRLRNERRAAREEQKAAARSRPPHHSSSSSTTAAASSSSLPPAKEGNSDGSASGSVTTRNTSGTTNNTPMAT